MLSDLKDTSFDSSLGYYFKNTYTAYKCRLRLNWLKCYDLYMNKTPLPNIGSPATRALNSAGIKYLEDLTGQSENSLAAMHGVGPKAVRLLKQALAEAGLSLLD